jgi:hypothetical protein
MRAKGAKSLKDPRGGHVRIYWRILDSPAWKVLTNAEKILYLALRRKLTGTNNGNISATLSSLKAEGVKSSSTLSMGLRSLETVGLIAKTRYGGIATGGKICCLYRFTDEVTYEQLKLAIPHTIATFDWERFKTLSQARDAIGQLSAKKKVKLRQSKLTDSIVEAGDQITDSTIEVKHSPKVRQSKLEVVAASAWKVI